MLTLLNAYKYGVMLSLVLILMSGCQTLKTSHILEVRHATNEYIETKRSVQNNLQVSVWGEEHNPTPEVRTVFAEVVRDIVGPPDYSEVRFAESANILDAEKFRAETYMLIEKLDKCERAIQSKQTTLEKAHSRSLAWQGLGLGIGGLALLPLLWIAMRR